MTNLFARLPKPPPRRYLASQFDCANLNHWVRYHAELLARPLPTLSAVKRWLQDAQEPDWTISTDEKEAPFSGRSAISGSPYSSTPIRFDDLAVAPAADK